MTVKRTLQAGLLRFIVSACSVACEMLWVGPDSVLLVMLQLPPRHHSQHKSALLFVLLCSCPAWRSAGGSGERAGLPAASRAGQSGARRCRLFGNPALHAAPPDCMPVPDVQQRPPSIQPQPPARAAALVRTRFLRLSPMVATAAALRGGGVHRALRSPRPAQARTLLPHSSTEQNRLEQLLHRTPLDHFVSVSYGHLGPSPWCMPRQHRFHCCWAPFLGVCSAVMLD